MGRKGKKWVTFELLESEFELLERYCEYTSRTKREVLREFIRTLQDKLSSSGEEFL